MLTTFLKEWRLVTINTNSIISFLVQISVLLYLQFVVMLKLNKKKGIEILFVMMYYLYLSYYLFLVYQWLQFDKRSTPQQRSCLLWKGKRCPLLAWSSPPSCYFSRTSGLLTAYTCSENWPILFICILHDNGNHLHGYIFTVNLLNRWRKW